MLKEVMLVGGGAFVGANARYGVTLLSTRYIDSAWPYGTLIANLFGSLVLGFFFALLTRLRQLGMSFGDFRGLATL